MIDFNVTGTYVWYYCICQREVWLLAHGIEADQENDSLKYGKVIHDTVYMRNNKEIEFGHSKFDVISKANGKVLVGEIKKSSRFIESARMQLLFYLKQLQDNNIIAEGMLLFPEEKRREYVFLDKENLEKLNKIICDIHKIVNMQKPFPPKKIKYCRKCAYSEFCWS